MLGPAVKPLAPDAYARLAARVSWNGRDMQGGVGSNALGGGDLALTWLANHLVAHGAGLKEGDIITTGVITEFFSAAPGDLIEASFEGLGEVALRF